MADELVTRVLLEDAQALAEWRKLQEEARNFAATIRTQVNMSFTEFANTLSKAAAGGDNLFKSMMQGANEMRASVNAAKTDLLELIAQTRAAETASIRIGSFGSQGGGNLPGTLPAQQHLLRGSVLDPDFVREQAQDVEREVNAFFSFLNGKTAAALPRGQRPAFFDLPEMMGGAQMGVPRSVTDTLSASQIARAQRPDFFELPTARTPAPGNRAAAMKEWLDNYRTDVKTPLGGEVGPDILKGLGQTAEEAAESVGKGMDGIQSRTKRGTMAILELSRGAEDFAVSAQTGGFAMGMRSAINNMAQFAFILHPMAGVVAGFAGALAAVAVPALMKAADAGKSFSDVLDEINARLDISGKLQELAQGVDLAGRSRAGQSAEEVAVEKAKYDIQNIERTAKSQLGDMPAASVERFLANIAEGKMHSGIELAGEARRASSRNPLSGIDAARAEEIAATALKSEADLIVANSALEQARIRLEKSISIDVRRREEKKTADIMQDALDAEMEAAREEIANITWVNDQKLSVAEAEIAQRQKIFDALDSEIASLSEMSSEEKRYAQAVKDATEAMAKDQPDDMKVTQSQLVDVYSEAQEQAKERRERLEEITQREEELRDKPQSLQGTIVGLQEMGRRIQEAAGKPEDSTKEELKRLRDERKKIAEQEKEQRRELAESLRRIADNTANPPVGVAG